MFTPPLRFLLVLVSVACIPLPVGARYAYLSANDFLAPTSHLAVAVASAPATRATAVSGNSAPDISAPSAVSFDEGQDVSLSAQATDSDVGQVLSITVGGAPGFLSLSGAAGSSPLTATLSGTAAYTDAGTYTIVWTVTDDGDPPASATASTTLTVSDAAEPPVITAPSSATGSASSPVVFDVVVTSPGDQPIQSLEATSLPPDATFSVEPGATGGRFRWVPDPAFTGEVGVTFSASSAAGRTEARTTISVSPATGPGRPWVSPDLLNLRVGDARSERFLTRPGDGRTLVNALGIGGISTDELRARGIEVNSRVGRLMTLRCPVDSLPALFDMPGLRAVLAPGFCQLLLDSSATDVRVAGLRTVGPPPFEGQTGSGVLVGIVDTGVDVTHDDFKHADGSTRILRYWDQTLELTPPRPPSGFSYGTEWTNQDIDQDPSLVAQYSPDPSGHGTHVAGIAAGNGNGGVECRDKGHFTGTAPEADLCAVKLPVSNDETTIENSVWDGIRYVFGISEPAVVNLSLGTHWGGHDGTYFFDVFIDSMIGPGEIVIAAAGNEAEYSLHAKAIAEPNKPDSTIELELLPYTPNSGSQNDYVHMLAWYSREDTIAVSVVTPSGAVFGPVGHGQPGYFSTTEGDIFIQNETGVTYYPWRVDHQIEIWLRDYDATHWPRYDNPWQLNFREQRPGTGMVDVYIEEYHLGAFTSLPRGPGFTVGRVAGGVVRSPASADSVIAVGAHTAKECWDALGHVIQCDPQSEVLGDIAQFSSQGPRRDGIVKPNLTAPGACVISTKSAQKPTDPTYDAYGGQHTVLSGTSQAAPQVAGAAALLLASPGWGTATPTAVLGALHEHSRGDAITGSLPNYAWGYGRLTVSTLLPSAFSVGIVSPRRGAISGPTAFTVVVGGNAADSVVLDLAVDTCRTHSARVGSLVNLEPGVPRTLPLVLADSLVSSYATLLASAYSGSNRVQVISPPFVSTAGPVAVETGPALPRRFALGQNAPNPFNPLTTIRFEVARAGPVTLRIYGMDGRLVRTLIKGVLPAGPHVVRWDGYDDRGVAAASGVYVCEAASDGKRIMRKMTLLK